MAQGIWRNFSCGEDKGACLSCTTVISNSSENAAPKKSKQMYESFICTFPCCPTSS